MLPPVKDDGDEDPEPADESESDLIEDEDRVEAPPPGVISKARSLKAYKTNFPVTPGSSVDTTAR